MGRTTEKLPETIHRIPESVGLTATALPIEEQSVCKPDAGVHGERRIRQLEDAVVVSRRVAHNLNNILTAMYCHYDLLPHSPDLAEADANYLRLKDLFAAAAAEVTTLSRACRIDAAVSQQSPPPS